MRALAARVLPWMLLTLVVAAPLVIGGVHDGTKLSLGLAGAVMVCVLRLGHGPQGFSHPFTKLGMAALAWIGLQCVPLPLAVVRWLHPAKSLLVEDAAQTLEVASPTWTALALDPGASCIEALYGVAILAVFLSSRRLREEQSGAISVLAVGLAAGFTSLVSLAHSALGSSELYGLYRPVMNLEDRWFISPLLNGNHAAALGILGVFAGCALWMERARTMRSVGGAVIFLSALMVLGSNSRAGIFLAVVGMAWLAFGLQRLRAASGDRWFSLRGPGLFLLLGAGLWVAIVLERTEGSVETGLLSVAPQAWFRALEAAAEHLWFGLGAGGLGYGTAPFASPSDGGLVTYAHNTGIQLLADFGLVFLVLAIPNIVRLLRGLWPAVRTDGQELALTIGLVAVLVQDQLEFPLFVPGVGLAAAAMLGAIPTTADVDERPDTVGRALVGPRRELLSVGLVLLASTFAMGALAVGRPYPHPMDSRPPIGSLDDKGEITATMLARPADFVFAQSVAQGALNRKEIDEATRFATLAVRRAPGVPSINRTRAAIALRSSTPADGLPFLSTFASAGPIQLEQATELLLTAQRPEIILLWLEKSPGHIGPVVRRLRGRGEKSLAIQLTRWGYERHGPVPEVLDSFIQALASDPVHEKELDDLATELLARAGNQPPGSRDRSLLRAGYLAQGFSLVMKGKPRIARELFVAAAREDAMRSAEPWLKAAESSFWAGEERLAMADLSRLRRDAGDQLHYRAYGDALESRIAESSGDHRRATRLLRRATRTMPWDRALGYQLVKLYERTGDEDRARALGEKLDSGAP